MDWLPKQHMSGSTLVALQHFFNTFSQITKLSDDQTKHEVHRFRLLSKQANEQMLLCYNRKPNQSMVHFS